MADRQPPLLGDARRLTATHSPPPGASRRATVPPSSATGWAGPQRLADVEAVGVGQPEIEEDDVVRARAQPNLSA
ncbi:hypothetical protein [Streptomyces mirabilis]